MVVPGTYTVSLAIRADGVDEELAGPESFTTTPLGTAKLAAEDRLELVAFQEKVARLQRAVLGSIESLHDAQERVVLLRLAIDNTPGATEDQMAAARDLEVAFADLEERLTGDRVVATRNEPHTPGPFVRGCSASWAASGLRRPRRRRPTAGRTKSPVRPSPMCWLICDNWSTSTWRRSRRLSSRSAPPGHRVVCRAGSSKSR